MDILNRQTSIETNEILFVGFDNYFYKSITEYQQGAELYSYKLINNSFRAYNWLESKVKNGNDDIPHAIVCEFNFLIEDNHLLLTYLQKHAVLKNIPFIIVATNEADMDGFDKVDAIKRGIDDCYSMPLNWGHVRRRIEFLHRFKSDLVKTSSEEIDNPADETFGYTIPKGKRMFDIFFASCVLLAISPILLLVALLVKLESKGPIFYYSKRAGNGYQVFDFIKFRSMCVGAESKLVQLAHLNQYSNNTTKQGASFVKLKNDPRVTKIGKFIRKTSIDELPQLINVLKGDMSIVGNRPLPLYEAEQITKDEWVTRFMAPAGLTGLWQVTKRGKDDMSVDERIALDINYANNYSMLMDLKIILKTLPAMIQKEQV